MEFHKKMHDTLSRINKYTHINPFGLQSILPKIKKCNLSLECNSAFYEKKHRKRNRSWQQTSSTKINQLFKLFCLNEPNKNT